MTVREKARCEELFEMEGGYVMDFSTPSFQRFVANSVGIDINDDKYSYQSGSKANRLRAFWDQEPDNLTGRLLLDLLQHWADQQSSRSSEEEPSRQRLYEECCQIADRLARDTVVDNMEAIQPYSDDRDYHLLAESIKTSITKGDPEVALDRLHTYMVKYVRRLCDHHRIPYDKNKPLHSLFGEYVKRLEQLGKIESQMTVRILKSSISVLSEFNHVRNNQSLAHDNPVLNYQESVLILNSMTSLVRFLQALERDNSGEVQQTVQQQSWEEIPF